MYYIIIFTIITILFIYYYYTKNKGKFWITQPVFHKNDWYSHFLLQNTVINKKIPEPKKYTDNLSVCTKKISEISIDEQQKITDFIKNNYLDAYNPTINDVMDYLYFNKSYISKYQNINGVITSRPLNVYLSSNTPLCVHYVDNLCVSKTKRHNNIAPKLIETHYYNICNDSQKPFVCLFKREIELTNIVPLCLFNIKSYNVCDIIEKCKEIEYKNIKLAELTDIIQIKEFIKDNFNVIILPQKQSFQYLLQKNHIKIFGLVKNNKELIALYVFKITPVAYEKTNNTLELISSINKCCYKETFQNGLTQSIKELNKQEEYSILLVESTSHNELMDISPKTQCKSGFYLYNYIKNTIDAKDCFIIY